MCIPVVPRLSLLLHSNIVGAMIHLMSFMHSFYFLLFMLPLYLNTCCWGKLIQVSTATSIMVHREYFIVDDYARIVTGADYFVMDFHLCYCNMSADVVTFHYHGRHSSDPRARLRLKYQLNMINSPKRTSVMW